LTRPFEERSIQPNRRTFLKASGFAAISTVLTREVHADPSEVATASSNASAPGDVNPVDTVNLLQGTASTFEFSRGNTLPISALPFGMAHWTLQSHADTPWFFQPGARRTQGFRCTHQLSPWLDDYGHATFLPFCGDTGFEPAVRASSYNPESSRLLPYSMQLFLLRYRAQVELVPTERGAILTASFDASKNMEVPGLLIDIPGEGVSIEADRAKHQVRFKSSANAGGVPENFATYYVVAFPGMWQSLEEKQVGNHHVGVVRFRPGQTIEARIGTSFISFEQAALNLETEMGSTPVEELRAKACDQWNSHLNRVQIEGASDEQRRLFYSCMYRALLFPRTWHEPNASGEMHHFSAFNGKVMPGVMYADHGYWDVYRAWYPFMSILFPERLGEILQAWVNAYREGGWMPQFPAPGYRACMTGSLIDSVFADAAVKGISGFNLADAYEGLKKHATIPGNPAKGYGRVGSELYLRHGYIPADRIQQSVAETADAAYGDFCIAQVAQVLGKQGDHDTFLKRSEAWRNIFNSSEKFLCGKNEDGSWAAPFDPFTWGSPYVEGSAWQHRWDVPHDMQGLIERVGGDKAAVDALEKMLAMEPKFNVGVYGTEIHEMSEMAAVKFGQYAHSNQPVHHLLYIFAHAGRPDLTQLWVRKVMQCLYTSDSFPGDEDTGSMSAWFILSAMGFYPLCPGKTDYTLGSPLFKRITLRLPHRKSLVIEASGNIQDAVYVRSASLNGQSLSGHTVEHAALMGGGVLRFTMATST
jgi:predicted alpha-1,2-mannosidase